MSSHDEMVGEVGLPMLLEHFGEPVKFEQPDVEEREITALVGDEKSERIQENGKTKLMRVRTVTIRSDESGSFGGVGSPQTNAVVTIEGTPHRVLQKKRFSSEGNDLVVTSTGAVEHNRPNYRHQR